MKLSKQYTTYIGLTLVALGLIALLWSLRRAAATEAFQATTIAPLPRYLAAKCSKRSLNLNQNGASIPASTSGFPGGATWFCEDDTSAKQLIRGETSVTPIAPFIAPNDSVCVKQEDDSDKYICKDLASSEEDGDYTDILSENYELSCENYVKGYVDLSNNLTNLVNLRDVIQDQKNTLTDSKTMLTNMFSQYQCANPPTNAKRIICNAINNANTNFTGNETTVEGILTQVIAPVQQVLESRLLLGRNASGFRCDITLPCDVLGTCQRINVSASASR
jgi:hypothetical protein